MNVGVVIVDLIEWFFFDVWKDVGVKDVYVFVCDEVC